MKLIRKIIRKMQVVRQVFRGYKTYVSLTMEYGEDCHFFIAPFPGTGDTYYDCQVLPQYCRENQIDNYTLLTDSRQCHDAALLFPKTSILFCQALGDLICFNAHVKCLPNIHFLHYDGPRFYLGILRHLRGINGLNFWDLLWLWIPETMALHREAPVFEDVGIQNYIRENKLQKGKSVILATYAKTVPLLSNKFWEKLASDLLDAGYHVYTNCTGKGADLPVKGTSQILIPYTQLKPVLEFCGVYIGLRSGLTDILETVDCTKIVLYPRFFPKGHGSSLENYSFKNIGRNDFVECIYNDKRHMKLLSPNHQELVEDDIVLIDKILNYLENR